MSKRTRALASCGCLVVALSLVAACPGESKNLRPPITLTDGASGGITESTPPATDGGGAPAPAPGAGTKTCSEIDSCAAACTDQSCASACLAQGTADAQAKYNALLACDSSAAQSACKTQCAAANSAACSQCLDQACATQLTACFGATPPPAGSADGGVAPSGQLTCQQVGACFDGCAQSNTSCYDTCFAKGTADAQTKMDALEQCWATAEQGSCKSQCANPSSQQCTSCEDQLCVAQQQACS